MSFRISCGEKKHAGGKIVKVCLRFYEDEIRGVIITGDFFAEPDHVYDSLISELSSLRIGRDRVMETVINMIRERGLKLHGVTMDEVREAIRRALEEGMRS
ncbi:MAG: hypothetical protein QXE68_06480 [Sulfolobales archaeon]